MDRTARTPVAWVNGDDLVALCRRCTAAEAFREEHPGDVETLFADTRLVVAVLCDNCDRVIGGPDGPEPSLL